MDIYSPQIVHFEAPVFLLHLMYDVKYPGVKYPGIRCACLSRMVFLKQLWTCINVKFVYVKRMSVLNLDAPQKWRSRATCALTQTTIIYYSYKIS